ncbi:hypothetical protein BV898_07033 [Hypsibius exemplaris]|uniref:Uncharacterized protein n=1 Tax=Hypsibius exemplaris TaxID=2072580 RepID=A0A1W0WUT7_HYPEX|nr:hypothetical protein BV898_07033 [Hypsibius exemplaris]
MSSRNKDGKTPHTNTTGASGQFTNTSAQPPPSSNKWGDGSGWSPLNSSNRPIFTIRPPLTRADLPWKMKTRWYVALYVVVVGGYWTYLKWRDQPAMPPRAEADDRAAVT